MSSAAVSGASPTKARRRTRAEMEAFNRAIYEIVELYRPCSARHTYYQAAARDLVPKDVGTSRKSEKKVGKALNDMRENGTMPFTWITDNTRTRFQVATYDSRGDALREIAHFYRQNLWRAQERHVEVWCESDSIAGVLHDLVVEEYAVALLPCRGQAPKRFVWDSAQDYATIGKPVTAFYVGDFDPNGLDIGHSVRERLKRYSPNPDPDVEFVRLGINAEQVRDLGLIGHQVNPNISDKQKNRFYQVCDAHDIPRQAVEAEALDPNTLRQIVEAAIIEMIDPRMWELELAVEAEERRGLAALAGWST